MMIDVAYASPPMTMVQRRENARSRPSAVEQTSPDEGAAVRTRGGTRFALALMAGVALIWVTAVVLILRPAVLGPQDAGKLFVVFAPGIERAAAFEAIVKAEGEPIRPALGSWGWVAHGEGHGFVGRLEAEGALVAFRNAPGGLSLAGCFAFIDPDEPRLDPLTRALDARLSR